MSWAELAAFNIAIVGALFSPGPALLAVIRSSFVHGKRGALACGAGLALGATGWSALAVLGLTALFALVPWAFLALKIGGAAYLLWLAVALWRNADTPVAQTPPRAGDGFRLGLLTNMANPKAVIFLAAIFTTVFPSMPTGLTAVTILFNHLALELVFYAIVAMILNTPAARAAYLRLKGRFDRFAAGLLVLMALRTAT